jgi:rare lipoprotein A
MPLSRSVLAAAVICLPIINTTGAFADQAEPRSFSGMASYYAERSPLANGGRFDPTSFTAAHRTLPLGAHVLVTNPSNGRATIVLINDRGPYKHGRVLDLSLAAARALGMLDKGVIFVRATVL